MGELVTVTNAYGVSRPNQYGDVWVRGDWRVTGKNKHGGLTMSDIGTSIPRSRSSNFPICTDISTL